MFDIFLGCFSFLAIVVSAYLIQDSSQQKSITDRVNNFIKETSVSFKGFASHQVTSQQENNIEFKRVHDRLDKVLNFLEPKDVKNEYSEGPRCADADAKTEGKNSTTKQDNKVPRKSSKRNATRKTR